jgi:hypothetical protein
MSDKNKILEVFYIDKYIEVFRGCPLIETEIFRDTKDPCPVFDGKLWHLYGSGGSVVEEVWHILHATAPEISGPWELRDNVKLIGVSGPHVAAPSIMFDQQEKLFHMFVQTDFLRIGGTIEHLTSSDGITFTHVDTALESISLSAESGIYDPHMTIIGGQKYLSYSAMFVVGYPEIYLAKSTTNTWYGPWERLGRIMDHSSVPIHNNPDHPDYEWGLEGSQLIELPNGNVVMNAVCFLPEGVGGTRQRIFLAVAKKVNGPYKTIGAFIEPKKSGYDSGENGHACALVYNGIFYIFYQARVWGNVVHHPPWRYCLGTMNINDLQDLTDKFI